MMHGKLFNGAALKKTAPILKRLCAQRSYKILCFRPEIGHRYQECEAETNKPKEIIKHDKNCTFHSFRGFCEFEK